ncbi:LuxR C-terminal-related transcriptional regulator [Streptomyces sp. NPDC087851]|uniref:helix-turn-helix transcriptional regulator n=1 Tax=Streptomyces sp. NPDC087851 TaxID=3365810 RepID=UPI00382BAEE8
MFRTHTRGKPFIGRYDQLRALSQALDDTAREGVVRCVVSGEAGIGRTALLDAFVRSCRARGVTAVKPTAPPGVRRKFRELAGGPFTPCRAPYPALSPGRAGGATRTASGARPALSPALPGLSLVVEEPDTPASGLLNGALAVLGEGEPVVLVVDDANHTDAALLHSVLRVVEEAAGLPLLVLLTERSGEPPRDPAAFAELTLGARRLTLDGLTPRETGEMLRSRLGSRPGTALAASCHRAAAGNPYLLASLATQVRGASPFPGPGDLDGVVVPAAADLLVGRAARLTPHARCLAETVAVAGDAGGAEPALIAHLSGLDLVETLTGLDVLARARLVTDGDNLTLRHPLLAHALLHSMTRLARNAAHLAAASYLHKRRAPVERVARHLSASTVPQHGVWSADVMLDAAAAAREAGHEDIARRYLEAVADNAAGDERRRAVLELADLHLRQDPVAGPQALVALLRRAGDDTVRRSLLARLDQALMAAGSAPGGTDAVLDAAGRELRGTVFEDWHVLHRLLSRLPELPPIVAEGLFAGLPPHLRPDAPDTVRRTGTGADEAGSRAPHVPVPDNAPLPTVAQAVAAYYRHLVDSGRGHSADWARAALARGTSAFEVHPPALAAALTVLVDSGHPAEATACLDRLGDITAATLPDDKYRGRADLLWVGGQIACAEGDLGTACRLLVASLALLDHPHAADVSAAQSALRASTAGLLANVRVSRGEPDEAETLLREGGWLGRLPSRSWYQDVLLARARIAAGNGALAAAARDLTELLKRARTGGLRPTGTASWRAHGVELLDQTGLTAEATTLAQEQSRFARATGSTLEQGRALRALARSGAPDSASLLREAVALLEFAPAPLDLASALTDLGGLAARQGRREESTAALTRAVQLAEGCGAGELALRAGQQILAANDDTTLHASLRGVLSLTPREREILVDAMRGLTNKRISESRTITSRTVELHLSSAYRKLGISGRADFPRVFHAPGLWTVLTSLPPASRGAGLRRTGTSAVTDRTSVRGGGSLGADRDVRPHRRGPDWRNTSG